MSIIPEELCKFYEEKGWWENNSIWEYLERTYNLNPEKIAITDMRGKFTWKEVYENSLLLAKGLQSFGIKKGDIITCQLPNSVEINIIFYACIILNVTFTPIQPIMREKEIEYIFQQCNPRIHFTRSNYRSNNYLKIIRELSEKYRKGPIVATVGSNEFGFLSFQDILNIGENKDCLKRSEINPSDPCLIIYTSGTESNLKGVMHNHNTLLYGAEILVQELALTKEDCVWEVSPITHASGFLVAVILPVKIGCSVLLQEHFEPIESIYLIEKEKATLTLAATPFLKMILDESKKVNHLHHFLKIFICGGSSVPKHLVEEAEKTLGCRILEVFGMSEILNPIMTRLDDQEHPSWVCDGFPTKGCDFQVLNDDEMKCNIGEVGEICLRSPAMTIGYYNNEELNEKNFTKDGFIKSGDLGKVNPGGCLHITGRKKDIIIRGGYNISAREVEEIILQHPLVQDVAVVGYPDERLGEKACAFVVLKNGRESLDLSELTEFMKNKGIAIQKLPERIEIIKELPMTGSGKVQKYKLKQLLSVPKQ